MEFYTSYQARQESMVVHWQVVKLPDLPLVFVRGVEVDITPKTINSLFWDEKIRKWSTYIEKTAKKNNHLQWVANTSTVDHLAWATMGGEISNHDLKFESKL